MFNKKNNSLYLIILFLFLSIYFVSCKPTRYLNEGEYILTKVNVECENKDISKKDIIKYNKQVPIRKTFGIVALHARLYNIPNPKKDDKRIAKKNTRLQEKNDKVEKRFREKSAKILSKKNQAWADMNASRKEGDSINTQKYRDEVKKQKKKYQEFNKDRSDKIEDLQSNKVFTFYEWFRGIGEEPPIYDSTQTTKSISQFKLYLKNKGYYDAEIIIKTEPKREKKLKRKKKIKVIYEIIPNQPLIIDTVEYNIPDTNIRNLIMNKEDLLIKSGNLLDIGFLQTKQVLIFQYLKDNGYFYFSKEYIKYSVDTLGRGKYVKLIVDIKQFTNYKGEQVNHSKYFISDIFIFSDYNPNEALQHPETYFNDLEFYPFHYTKDSIEYTFIKKNELIIKEKTILNELYIYPDTLYNFSNVKNTYSHLSKFQIYKLTNIQFTEADTINHLLNCEILLTPQNRQEVFFDIEATKAESNFGTAASFKYTHKNLLKRGEVFDFKTRAALERQNFASDSIDTLYRFFNIQEYSVELRMTIPRLLSPVKRKGFIKRNNPKTVVSLSINYQDRPEYHRISAGLNLDYYWKNKKEINYILTPIRLSAINVTKMSPVFWDWLTSNLLENSYEDHFIAGSNFSFTYSNQDNSGKDYLYIKYNAGWAGNILYGIMRACKQDTIDGSFVIPFFDLKFAQFVKSDIDFRFYNNLRNGNQVVSRIFIGVGLPYGNMNLMPFGEKYFAGGANGIRAWQVRSLGPGGYSKEYSLNQTGDIKLEANLEYRIKIFKLFEGALFIDAGNIWAINEYDNRENAQFYLDSFIEQIAIGTGFGIRLDVSFLIIRVDIGVKLYNPAAADSYRWIPFQKQYSFKEDFTLNFGIGYPF